MEYVLKYPPNEKYERLWITFLAQNELISLKFGGKEDAVISMYPV